MGAFASRNHGVEEVDISSTNAYRYPPKSGCYFGSHFIMGGDRFETTQPEAYLFGENQDLNFLGNRPVPFPYPAPQAHEPTKTLKSLVNIRKDSLKFVKVLEEENTGASDDATEPEAPKLPSTPKLDNPQNQQDPPKEDKEICTKYNIEFTFDSDVKCAITIYYFAVEEISNKQAIYRPRDPSMNSETFHYKRGANQVFSQTTHILDPTKFPEEEWQYNPDKDIIPVVIQCVVEEEEYIGHSHMMFAIVEKGEGGFCVKPLKQKQMVDGLCYLLQEIYGIENKNSEGRPKDDDLEDNGSECVICLVEMRDTLILPCRHLCLCNCCADNLRYQASNCPICRSPFRALLQIRAMRKKHNPLPLQVSPSESSDEAATSQDGIPPGYEAVSLIEALNGPPTPTIPTASMNLRNYPDAVGGEAGTSLPTTPEASPMLGRRRLRRKASSSSTRSRQSISGTTVEKAKETLKAKSVDSVTVPEVIISNTGIEPKKSPQKKFTKAETKCPTSKVDLNEHIYDEPDLKIVDETKQSHVAEKERAMVKTEDCKSKSTEDIRHATPEPDYETFEPIGDSHSQHRNSLEIEDPSYYKPAEEDPDSDGLGMSRLSLGSRRLEDLDVEKPDGSGSSFSSTESSKGLLAHTDLDKSAEAKDDDTVLV